MLHSDRWGGRVDGAPASQSKPDHRRPHNAGRAWEVELYTPQNTESWLTCQQRQASPR